jgi:hypothetical protein
VNGEVTKAGPREAQFNREQAAPAYTSREGRVGTPGQGARILADKRAARLPLKRNPAVKMRRTQAASHV